MCNCSTENHPCLELYQSQCNQEVERDNSLPSLCSYNTPPPVLQCPQDTTDLGWLRWVQRRATQMIRGVKLLSWKAEQFGIVYHGEGMTLRRPFEKIRRLSLLGSVVIGWRGMTLNTKMLDLILGIVFFTIRVVRPWDKLPREVIYGASLEVFKAIRDGFLNNLV